jgi:MFS family permease
VLFLIGTGRCFSGPASAALLPSLVPEGHFVNAVTWGATLFQVANAAGPALGGLLFTWALLNHPHWAGAPIVYLFTLFCLLWFIALISLVRPRPVKTQKSFTLNSMLAGMHYVWQAKLLLGSISLDLFAVLLGGAVALLPIFASDVLHAGPRGLGLLRAMPSIGALVVSAILTVRPIRRNAGRLMLSCVGIFGVGTIVFGLSKSIWVSLIALFAIGASDMVSVVVRTSIVQLATPPEMRGRVSAINWLFVGASNEFGEFESGVTAHWWGAVRAVVVGGVCSLMVTGLWSVFFPHLRSVDCLDADSLLAAERELSTAEPIN